MVGRVMRPPRQEWAKPTSRGGLTASRSHSARMERGLASTPSSGARHRAPAAGRPCQPPHQRQPILATAAARRVAAWFSAATTRDRAATANAPEALRSPSTPREGLESRQRPKSAAFGSLALGPCQTAAGQGHVARCAPSSRRSGRSAGSHALNGTSARRESRPLIAAQRGRRLTCVPLVGAHALSALAKRLAHCAEFGHFVVSA
jgi:hypothetical protein